MPERARSSVIMKERRRAKSGQLRTTPMENSPFFADHETSTERVIPVVVLTRA